VLVATLLCALWAVALLVGEGVAIATPLGRLSSRNPSRPVVLAVVLGLLYYLRWRASWRVDAGRLAAIDWPRAVALVAAMGAFAIGEGHGVDLATGPDASGYVSQAERWAQGSLTRPAPAWTRQAPWGDATFTASPVGYRPGIQRSTIVPFYAPGFPLMMAPFVWAGGRDAALHVVPLLGAAAVWVTFLLGRWMGGPWAGAIASLFLLCSPVFLVMLVSAMSDVPATVCWGVALVMAVRPGRRAAALSGAACALAILTRPNVAPLAAIVGLVVVVDRRDWLARGAWFSLAVAAGAGLVAYLNWRWFGSPLYSAYGALGDIYRLSRVLPNTRTYTGWLLDTETPLLLLAVAVPLLLGRTELCRWRVWLLTAVFPLITLALYVPYREWYEWAYLRFLLPAFPPLLGGIAAVLVRAVPTGPRRPLAVVCVTVVVAAFVYHGIRYDDAWRRLANMERRYVRALDYVARLPRQAVFVSLTHSGTLAYYGGRDVFRWEACAPKDLDRAVAALHGMGINVYVVADEGERPLFLAYFAGSATAREVASNRAVDLGGVSVYAVGGTTVLPPVSLPGR
jgi:hypothetical protein